MRATPARTNTVNYIVNPSTLSGTVAIPGSKSHTIRALVFALLAEGTSVIEAPLSSSDTRSCVDMIRAFGAEVLDAGGAWTVTGMGGAPAIPDNVIDVGNSGTTLYIGLAVAALCTGHTVFTGDAQIRNRPADALLRAIGDLGGSAVSTRSNGKPPVVIGGPLRGGETSIEAVTSQYLTALLVAAPLVSAETIINIPLLYEVPYVRMTLGWLDRLGIRYRNENLARITVPGGQRYPAFREYVPADFSSATFFLVAAAIAGTGVTLTGLDFSDTQGDKEVVSVLRAMGAVIEIAERSISIAPGALAGGVFDLNAMPDSLPALAVAGCFASGETRLVNVPQARLKETDRIAVMCRELRSMGADIEELPDGLIVRRSRLRGAQVHGHGDHRVVMALAVAAGAAEGTTVIDTAEAVGVTFPGFRELMCGIGADIALGE